MCKINPGPSKSANAIERPGPEQGRKGAWPRTREKAVQDGKAFDTGRGRVHTFIAQGLFQASLPDCFSGESLQGSLPCQFMSERAFTAQGKGIFFDIPPLPAPNPTPTPLSRPVPGRDPTGLLPSRQIHLGTNAYITALPLPIGLEV